MSLGLICHRDVYVQFPYLGHPWCLKEELSDHRSLMGFFKPVHDFADSCFCPWTPAAP